MITNYTSTDVPKQIGPNAGTVTTSTLTVPDNMVIDKVEVTNIVITHTYPADMDVFLISPTGTRVELFTDVCGGDDWTAANTGFTLNPRASNPIGSTCPPGQGFYRPEGNLDAFVGQNTQGVWILEITDDANADAGSLLSWGLRFTSGGACPTKTADATITATVTRTPTNTRTSTTTRTSTAVTTETAVGTGTAVTTGTAVATGTGTAVSTQTRTAVSTGTGTAVSTQTLTVVPATGTGTAVSTRTATMMATTTQTAMATMTRTMVATTTQTAMATMTRTAMATTTQTAMATMTRTTVATMTRTAMATGSVTASPTACQGRVTICHRTGNGGMHTITVSCNALPAHLRHGDTVGPCPAETPRPRGRDFNDVSPGEYFYEHVMDLRDANVISGYADNTFRPFNNTTRGQFVKIVVLAFHIPLYSGNEQSFTDVPTSHTFYRYIETARRDGIITGYSDGTFRPFDNVTRGQVAKIAVEAAQLEDVSTNTPSFTDVPVGSTFYNYIETAYANGILSGYADRTFRPFNDATRGQVSKIVDIATHVDEE
jgi:subtilisin-like proprotein convertase family protein